MRVESYQTILAAFWDGFRSPTLLFSKADRPGSSSAELGRMTTPGMLAAYGKVDPSLPESLLDLKNKERKRDVTYVMLVRLNGIICLLVVLIGFCYTALTR